MINIPVEMCGRWINLNVEKSDITWDFLSLEAWICERDRLKGIDINASVKNLERFTLFMSKTIYKICNSMMWQKKIPQELFTFRDLFTEKVYDFHMPYMNAYYQCILTVINEEIPYFVKD